ncbi:MAG: hypothetical protein ACLP2P_10450 [Desulfobaccales bacterium]
MGILKSWFKPKPPPEDPPTYKIVEKHLSIDDRRYQVRIKKGGRELYVEDLFQMAKMPGDLAFGRFFLLDEKPPKPHFAPSLKEAVDWFRGRDHPRDGYDTIWWGDQVTYECSVCKASRTMPLRITQVERLAVGRMIPQPMQIVGWRVAEVESDLTGKGIPTRRLEANKLKPIVIWYDVPNRYLCRSCAQNMTAAGRPPDPADYFVFDVE